ncbi:protealysin inhibitor emfourin [Actinomadura yumaensis]|uniref:Protealysin inhibitor emfourin n=1 Tax=Actinomadura yumaensis TaxID=111807 RepID=A0ABW2CRU2_9ACTN|nr:hypothetical protein [Actinomadura sp. J1-007]
MKIESTGGFAGREVMVALYDTADLPAEQAERVRAAVEELASAREPEEVGADLPAYRITIDADESGGTDRTGGTDESGGTDEAGVSAPRVFEVRGDPTGPPLTSSLATLLQGPG